MKAHNYIMWEMRNKSRITCIKNYIMSASDQEHSKVMKTPNCKQVFINTLTEKALFNKKKKKLSQKLMEDLSLSYARI